MDIIVDFAEIVGSLATAAALVWIIANSQHSRRALEEAERLRHLESKRDDRAMAAAERGQASKVVAWPVKGEIDGKAQWGLELVNASDLPVFDLRIERPDGNVSRSGAPIPGIRAAARVLPPGRYFVSERQQWPLHVDSQRTFTPTSGNADYMASLVFTDSDGLGWRRAADGRLEAAEREPSQSQSQSQSQS
jgi:hypothetical protein